MHTGIPPRGTREQLCNKKCENNPMHSSRPLSEQGLAQDERSFWYYEIELTRRAKHWQNIIIAAAVSVQAGPAPGHIELAARKPFIDI
ncbi:hypothetical protein IVB15_33960 [Bradyrhizobium sp. 182]|uniref:hypothetical protein n=2 Tax=Bradyrhizobium TaxID=374 RepID=UPI001FF7C537|nr:MULTISPECIES: hypothetical protein [unclassified Bradyrhizobium]MCK1422824.1 hypothetical protein [Bradyrhizobium sp. CW12]MCK1532568.1 hypothetical protein [Bradyrhizobium sp. 182]MCK1598950.1 hypothetical protein [Bradyrhizobium sp. 164]MCK1648337.1 hypothetical protein [Bradyrhizobium sp. 154]MCK1665969.1 hypothetical protein [Bradyrhizobium sp. 153]